MISFVCKLGGGWESPRRQKKRATYMIAMELGVSGCAIARRRMGITGVTSVFFSLKYISAAISWHCVSSSHLVSVYLASSRPLADPDCLHVWNPLMSILCSSCHSHHVPVDYSEPLESVYRCHKSSYIVPCRPVF